MPENDVFLESRAHREATLHIYEGLVECGDSNEVQNLLLERLNQSGALAGVSHRKRGVVGALAMDRAIDIYDVKKQIDDTIFYIEEDWN